MSRRGTSIIEVLLSVAIIVVLASLLLGSIHSAREKGRTTMCINNLKNLTTAMILFANDNGKYPELMAFKQELYEEEEPGLAYATSLGAYYDNQVGVTRCPKVNGTISDATPVYSYGINQLIRNVSLGKVQHPSEIIITGESLNQPVLGIVNNVEFRHVYAAAAGFADGHVQTVRASELVNALENYYGSSPLDSAGFGVLRVPGPFIIIGDTPFNFANDHVCASGFRWDYLGLTNNGNGTSTFSFKITNNNDKNLIYTVFELPAGKSAVSPANGSTYTGPTDTYNVDNPTENPFHALKFHKTGQAIKNGESDTFVFTLNNSDIGLIQTMRVQSKASATVGQGVFDTQPTPDSC